MPIFSAVSQPGASSATSSNPAETNQPAPSLPKTEPVERSTAVKIIRRPGASLTPSIKDALAGNVAEKKVEENVQTTIYAQYQEEVFEPFTVEQLTQKWNEFLDQITDRPNLRSTLANVPELSEGNKLLLRVGNSVQEEEIRLVKPELVSWLRRELSNAGIEIITRLEKVETERTHFNDSEKMQMMIQKNPELFELKQKFNLDFNA